MEPPQLSVPSPGLTGGPPAFHMLAKPTGATCNLDCEYCFFLSKEMLYPGSRFRMADELLETYIRQLIEAHRTPHVAIAWQGGEPTLMGADFFRRAHAYVEKYRRPGMQIEYTIQTNGTLIDDELAALFKEHDYLVGISIDGPPAMHDTYRVDRGGAPTSARVLRGLETLKRHGVEFNTLTTLHRANADHPLEVYRYLRDELGSRYLQFIPIIERLPSPRIDVTLDQIELSPGLAREAPWRSWRDRPLYRQEGELVTDRSVTADQYGRFLNTVFDEWVRTDIGTVYVQMFDVALGQLVRRAGRAVRLPADVRRARSRWSTTAMSTRATTSSRRATSSATSPRPRWPTSSPRRPNGSSARTSSTRCRSSASTATSGSPATAPARRTASSGHRTASPGSTTCAAATRRSSITSTTRCGRCRRSSGRAGRRPS